jgi:hypothetical protein
MTTSAKKKLVITSDDLGMTHSVNQGIHDAASLGAITSTNFMVPCPWFEHAVDQFRDASIDLGVHLTLTCEWPNYKWRPLTMARSLLDASGSMHTSIEELVNHATPDEITNECRRQIEIALQKDLPIIYADLHMCIPTIEYGDANSQNRILNTPNELAAMTLVDSVVREFGLNYPYALSGNRLTHFDSALSISGKSRETVATYLRSLRPGIHHLSCHCAVESDEQRNLAPAQSPNYPWALDYRRMDFISITSEWFRDLLDENQIELSAMPFTATDARQFKHANVLANQ